MSCTAATLGAEPSVVEGPGWRKLFGPQAKPLPAACGLTDQEIANLAEYVFTAFIQPDAHNTASN